MKKILSMLLLAAAAVCMAAEITVKPENAVIVVDPKADAVPRLAAQELQYYVKMMTGKTIPIAAKAAPGKYAFVFQKPAGVKLKPEEAVWEVSPEKTLLYGDSGKGGPRVHPTFIFRYVSKTGDLTAVYDFLEQQLGFLFLAPGELGTSYTPASVLKLKTGRNSWEPGLNSVHSNFHLGFDTCEGEPFNHSILIEHEHNNHRQH